jgi:hypothetical protein
MNKPLAFFALSNRGYVPAALVVLLACSPRLFAQTAAEGQAKAEDHIVSSQTLQQQVETSSATRQKDIATVTGFLASPTAERAMRDARLDPAQVRTAVPALSDQELANLSARASDAQQRFAAGMISNDELLIVILLVAIIIIVAAVH